MLITLDPGHGGADPGAIGPVLKLKESDYALSVCILSKEILESQGVAVALTRSADKTLDMNSRIAATHGSDITVSVHLNATNTQSVEGVEVIYGAKFSESKRLSASMYMHLLGTGQVPRGIKKSPSPEYQRKLAMCYLDHPSCLCEIEFLSNPKWEAWLDKNRDTIAMKICAGILTYFSP